MHLTHTTYTEGICPVCGSEMKFLGSQGNKEFWFCSTHKITWMIEFVENNEETKTIIKNLKDIQVKLIRDDVAA